MDETSHGFPLESSLLRSAQAVERLCGVFAITTLSLVTQGTAVVAQGKRRWGAAHGCRGQRDVTLGWHGVTRALSRGYARMTRLQVSADADPVPAMAATIQPQQQSPLGFTLEFEDAVA